MWGVVLYPRYLLYNGLDILRKYSLFAPSRVSLSHPSGDIPCRQSVGAPKSHVLPLFYSPAPPDNLEESVGRNVCDRGHLLNLIALKFYWHRG